MKLLLKKAHHLLYLGFVLLFFVFLYPLLLYFSKNPVRYPKMNKVRRVFSFLTSFCAGIVFKFQFREKVDWSGQYIVCANHTSNLDITAMAILMRSHYAFMGKDELLDNPVTGIFFRTFDIPVNRASTISAFRAFRKAADSLRKGMSLVIFPEGKIADEYPPTLQSFKDGPFRLAIEYQVPILPVSIKNIWRMMWDDGAKYGTQPGICNICVHEPIPTAHLTLDGIEALRNQVYETIKKGLDEN